MSQEILNNLICVLPFPVSFFYIITIPKCECLLVVRFTVCVHGKECVDWDLKRGLQNERLCLYHRTPCSQLFSWALMMGCET